ncbi:hypothetical protein FKG94_26655 [Exilibacterium tricleocarpae]|uniref:Uncharacterized protein n=1 Tax=Exilibacterium tricleocarpae TaxID=2591008 RepID=A0A545SPR3_9GAMM|nr:hypothetical protein [Exilibacterium tricleocarpae]TQV66937.1 hypothetical protein FKG94_26655 [Exilibacterium tricleocarpae]
MVTSQGYLLGWAVYLVGAVGLMVCWWRISLGIPQFQWRFFSRVVVGVLLLTPYYGGPEQAEWAPALVITLLEGVFYGPEAMLRAGVPILVTLLCAVLVSVLAQLGWHRYQERLQQREREVVQEDERQALLRESAEQSAGTP